ncbi:hypothetical protein O6H91_05G015000 [Diphasiastrum complanatum]|uniref:Uncharacterized protein n=1 Tax=Diphasiastrum complanatum TaxID=34168 RepID=A0ACC2DKZ3_DIPCM|nr:hypothetical protein O6H91_05G015000 [Diphasiastrum complanatum]
MPRGSKKFQRFMRNIKALQNLLSKRDSTVGSDWLESRSEWLESRSSSSWTLRGEDNAEFCDCEVDTVPADVPHGFLAVYVGNEKKRFVIHAQYLSHPLFKVLLDKSAEEFGFDQKGGLHLPCEVAVFENLMMLLNQHDLSTERLLLNQHDLSTKLLQLHLLILNSSAASLLS